MVIAADCNSVGIPLTGSNPVTSKMENLPILFWNLKNFNVKFLIFTHRPIFFAGMGILEKNADVESRIRKKIRSLYIFLNFLLLFFLGEEDVTEDLTELSYKVVFFYNNYHLFHILKSFRKFKIKSLSFRYKNYHGVWKTKSKGVIKKRLKKKLYKRNNHFLL